MAGEGGRGAGRRRARAVAADPRRRRDRVRSPRAARGGRAVAPAPGPGAGAAGGDGGQLLAGIDWTMSGRHPGDARPPDGAVLDVFWARPRSARRSWMDAGVAGRRAARRSAMRGATAAGLASLAYARLGERRSPRRPSRRRVAARAGRPPRPLPDAPRPAWTGGHAGCRHRTTPRRALEGSRRPALAAAELPGPQGCASVTVELCARATSAPCSRCPTRRWTRWTCGLLRGAAAPGIHQVGLRADGPRRGARPDRAAGRDRGPRRGRSTPPSPRRRRSSTDEGGSRSARRPRRSTPTWPSWPGAASPVTLAHLLWRGVATNAPALPLCPTGSTSWSSPSPRWA